MLPVLLYSSTILLIFLLPSIVTKSELVVNAEINDLPSSIELTLIIGDTSLLSALTFLTTSTIYCLF